ncbi:MAG: pilus assembly protein PilP [Rhodocyclaceae bacterium]|nr:MAG: pilus assembly protein PilP [Rhodocyclaceae bacterium]
MTPIVPITVVLASLMLGACGTDEHQDLKQWMKEATKDMKGRIKPLPEMKPFPIVSYEAAEAIDPFSPAKIGPDRKPQGSDVGGGHKPDFNRFREPLEAYPLESLKMVGLIQKGKMMNAIIKADKSVHLVKIGNYMGQNFGMITEITESDLELRELIQDSVGDWVERAGRLQLQEQEMTK